jgi:photosystem II stability/assembly factor-like uncharacterized protein
MPYRPIPVIVTAGVLTLGILPGALDGRETPATRGQVQLRQTEQDSGTRMLLQAISPVDDEVVWVSGHGGTVLHTIDGGLNWSTRVGPGADTLQFQGCRCLRRSYGVLDGRGPRPYFADLPNGRWR